MGVRTYEPRGEAPRARVDEPSRGQTALVALVIFLALVANGRPLSSGDTRASERVAASLVQQGNLDLDEYADVELPFAREVGGHRVSTYPVLSSVLAAPVFLAARTVFALDETGMALCGKLAASMFSALAAALLFVAVARRAGEIAAWTTALGFALGTTVWSTSQALWQHPAAVACLACALLFMHRAQDDPRWADLAALPLGLAVAARHANLFLVAVLALGLAGRFPSRIPRMLAWGAPGVAFLLLYQWAYFGSPWRHGFSGSLQRFSEPWGVGQAGLLISPGKGLVWFMPVALVAAFGVLQALRRESGQERWLPAAAGLAALAHLVVMGRWSEWPGGVCWGPRLLTDALPALFLFLPDGLAVAGAFGRLLLWASIGVQALGTFTYDNRWERVFMREPQAATAALWDPGKSPILFQARERVLKLALPAIVDGRAFVREHPLVPFGPTGSRLRFQDGALVVSGSESNFGDVHLQRGARVDGDRLQLDGRWDALFLRVREGARPRILELRVRGRGRGTLYVGERSFWSEKPRWTPYPANGTFRLRHPYRYAESGGSDLLVTVGKGDGEARLESVALVAPGDPDEPLELSSPSR